MSRVLICCALMLIAVSLTGCASRGEIVADTCPGPVVSVSSLASSAIYYDLNRNPIGKEENLDGTYFKRMCGSEALSDLPIACKCGTCDTVVKSKHYCLACTTNPCPPH